MLLIVHVTSVIFLARFNNFMGFYCSYTLLLVLPVLVRSFYVLISYTMPFLRHVLTPIEICMMLLYCCQLVSSSNPQTLSTN